MKQPLTDKCRSRGQTDCRVDMGFLQQRMAEVATPARWRGRDEMAAGQPVVVEGRVAQRLQQVEQAAICKLVVV